MAISNELSSDIAAAILGANKTPQELHALKNIVLEVHTALQKMSEEAHAARLKEKIPEFPKFTSSDSTIR